MQVPVEVAGYGHMRDECFVSADCPSHAKCDGYSRVGPMSGYCYCLSKDDYYAYNNKCYSKYHIFELCHATPQIPPSTFKVLCKCMLRKEFLMFYD